MLRKQIGNVLKAYREKLGRNQRDVAAEAGISTSMLSQIERGSVSPSIDTLYALCQALGLDMASVFSRVTPGKPYRVFRPDGRLRTQSFGVGYEQLANSPNPSYPAEMFVLEIDAGSQTAISENGHEGVEMGYVLEGSAVLCIVDEEVVLAQGDGISFSAHARHSLENRGKEKFRAVWSIQPPHKDYLELAPES